MINQLPSPPVVFTPCRHPVVAGLAQEMKTERGRMQLRHFPDGESYLRVISDVKGRDCILVADLTAPDCKVLPILFLAETLTELGASSVGLVAPYLCYMRQDKRFNPGEAITSQIFAKIMSQHLDWVVTVDPHLHRVRDLSEIYSINTKVVSAANNIARLLEAQKDVILVGPDEESEQWVSEIAQLSGHPFVVAKKERHGDKKVQITIPDIAKQYSTAVIVDDVISSGMTIIECAHLLKQQGIPKVTCVATHGIFADDALEQIYRSGVEEVVTSDTIINPVCGVDVADIIAPQVVACIQEVHSSNVEELVAI